MRTRVLVTLAVAAAATVLPVTAAAAVSSNPAHQPNGPNPTTVHEWLTTPGVETPTDASLPLNDTVTKTPVTVHVDPNVRFQQVSGFGAAITDSSAHVLYGLTPKNRDTVMRNLFDPKTGAGINFLRQPIGASDFAVGQDYSYDDLPAGQTDYQLRHFSIAHDQEQILPLLR
ncbi:MAG TPA: glucosylceramidase, partial [Kutzneria sp.]|nr:glucosylceramidase [Kutzneria sp.]